MSNHPPPTTEEDYDSDPSLIIHDNSSEIARTKIFPDNFIEPLVILAKIKGYKGIDDYVIHLIEHELESIRDGDQGLQDLGEYVIDYIAKILGPDDTTTSKVVRKEEST